MKYEHEKIAEYKFNIAGKEEPDLK